MSGLSLRAEQRPYLSAAMALALVTLAAAAAALSETADALDLRNALWLMLLGFLANLAVVLWDPAREETESGSGFIPLMIAALAYGPRATLLVAVASCLPYAFSETAQRFVRRMAARTLAAVLVSILWLPLESDHVGAFLLGGALCVAIYQGLQLLISSVIMSLETGQRTRFWVKSMAPHFGLALLLFGPMAVAYAYLVTEAPAAVMLVALVVIASHPLLITIQRARSFERLVSHMSAEIPAALLQALDAADSYTAHHSAAVAAYSYDLALDLELGEQEAQRIHAAALLHDVGKIGVPDAVLLKEGSLDEDEWRLVRRHTELGANMVSRIPGFNALRDGILSHHERWDGSGYPRGLSGDEIPLAAQIIGVVDTYSAITTARVYRRPRSPDFAISELQQEAQRGTLPARVVDVFIVRLQGSGRAYRRGNHTSLALEVAKTRTWTSSLHSLSPAADPPPSAGATRQATLDS